MPFTKGHPFYLGGEKGWIKKGSNLSDETRKRMSETRIKLGIKPPSQKGKSLSEEHKKKLSEAHIGKKGNSLNEEAKQYLSQLYKGKRKSEEHRINISKAKIGDKNPMFGKKSLICGEKHPNWKGGISEKNHVIRQSLEYKQWRLAVFKRDNFTCIFCKQLRGKIEADHIKRFSDYPELRFDINNGRTLCHECHKKTDTYGWKGSRRISV